MVFFCFVFFLLFPIIVKTCFCSILFSSRGSTSISNIKVEFYLHCQSSKKKRKGRDIPVFFSKTSDFVVGRVLEFRLRLNIQRDIIYKKFLSLVEITNVILKNRQCWKRRNLRKIAIFHHKFNNEKVF